MLPTLHRERLTLFVFGPGVGELIAVHVPPGVWMFVDGCSAGSRGYAKQLLDHYGGRVDLVLLTHPHLDHARGLAELVDETSSKDVSRWPVYGVVPLPVVDGVRRLEDPTAYLEGGATEHAIAAIFDRWERYPACRWTMALATTRNVGDAELLVLSPSHEAREKALDAAASSNHYDWNRLSTALMITWKDQRIVLGSDLVQRPGKGWMLAIRQQRDLARHDVLKVPHHGSVQALHKPLLRRRKESRPLWIVAPYSSGQLPDFGADGGVARLLEHVEEVHLTALPRRYADQGAWRTADPPLDPGKGPGPGVRSAVAGFPRLFRCV